MKRNLLLAVLGALALFALSGVPSPNPAHAQQSADSRLQALTVSPTDIEGFASDTLTYHVGVASTVTQAIVTATVNQADATISIGGTPVASGAAHAVTLADGANTVEVTVTAQNGSSSRVYTIVIGRGVTADYGWKATDDFNTMVAAGHTDPGGLHSDGSTMWVTSASNDRIYGYNLATKQRDDTKVFATLFQAGNRAPRGLFSDGSTMWVTDDSNARIFAYNLRTRQRDDAKDFNTLRDAYNRSPRGLFSDGSTMWVSDSDGDKLYAYNMETKARDAAKDFDTLRAAGNNVPRGLFSDGSTMWVTDTQDGKIYAYNMETKQRDPDKDFNTLRAAGNDSPLGLFSDGSTTWVVDGTDNKIYSYNNKPSDDSTLRALTVAPTGIDGFAGDPGTYHVGVANSVTQATVTATANHARATISIGGATVASGAAQTVPLNAGVNRVIVTVTAQDGSTSSTYTIVVGRGVTADYGWKATGDFNTLQAAGNSRPTGLFSNGPTLWVTDWEDGKIYAYNLATKQRDTAKDFNTLADAGNASPRGLFSDGAAMWVADVADGKIYAYNLETKARDDTKDFNTLADAGNASPSGLFSNGATMWVADTEDGKLYAYNLATKQRDTAKDFNTLGAAENENPYGLHSDGSTMWVADTEDKKIYAYNLETKARDAAKDFNTLQAAGNASPLGLFSDGETTWAVDGFSGKIYSYNNKPSDDSTLSALTVAPTGIDGFASDTLTYHAGVANSVTEATVTATANHAHATISIGGAAVASGDAHTVTLADGLNRVGVTVTAQDGSSSSIYTIVVGRGVTADYGWKATGDFNTLQAAGNGQPYGLFSNGETMWVADAADVKIYAYNLAAKARDAAKDFDTLAAAGNGQPYGLFSDGATMWVTDLDDNKIYAYNMETKLRDSGKDFNTLDAARNLQPSGLYSDGATMWVSDTEIDRIYAYNMETKQRVISKEFGTLVVAGNRSPYGLFSDGVTMWVADGQDVKVYAYNMETRAHDAAKEFNTLFSVWNFSPSGLFSDGATLWVADDADAKIYSYNKPLLLVTPGATLTALSLREGTLSPTFDSATTAYTVSVDQDTASVTVSSTAVSGATAAIAYGPSNTAATNGVVPLGDGDTEITVTVTATGGSTAYTITVTRLTPPALRELILVGFQLDERFDPEVTDYTGTVRHSDTQETLIALPADASHTVAFLDAADVAIADAEADGQQIALAVGANVVKVKVSNAAAESQTYTLTITRPTVNVRWSAASTVVVSWEDPDAGGCDAGYHVYHKNFPPDSHRGYIRRTGQAVTDNPGTHSNYFLVLLNTVDTAQVRCGGRVVGETHSSHYTHQFQRFDVSSGALMPAYDRDIMSYVSARDSNIAEYIVDVESHVSAITVTVENKWGVGEITFTDVDTGESETTQDGSGAEKTRTYTGELEVGDNYFEIFSRVGDDPDGAILHHVRSRGMRYSLRVRRAVPAADDATLSGLTLTDSNGTGVALDPAFAHDTYAYSAEVGSAVTSVSVAATATNEANASVVITYGDAATAAVDGVVPLVEGANAIKVSVTAEDGMTTQDYTITVTRPAPPPEVSINAGAAEAAEAGVLSFTVTRSGSTVAPLDVKVLVEETGEMVAAANKGTRTETIPANAATHTFPIATVRDTVWEQNSTVTVTVQAGDAYTLGGDPATTLVRDDDFPQATAVLSVDPASVAEGGGPVTATITVTTERDELPHGVRRGGLSLSTRESSAIADSDYIPLSATVLFDPDDFTRVDVSDDNSGVMRYRAEFHVEVTIVNDDKHEDSEQFGLRMERTPNSGDLTLDADTTELTVTITDDDLPTVSIEADAPEAAEGDALSFTVTRDGSTHAGLDVTVNVDEDGDLVSSANAGEKTVTIPIGQVSAALEVQTDADDDAWDEHSTVTATVQADAARYNLGADIADSTLVKDDDFPEARAAVSVSPNPVAENAGKVTATITVTTNADEEPHGDSPATLRLRTATTGATTATASADFGSFEESGISVPASAFNRVDIGSGNMRYRAEVTRDISITNDDVPEEEENFRVELRANPNTAPLITGGSQVVRLVVITDDDEAAASSDATLSALNLDGALVQGFNSATLDYTVNVGYGDTSIDVAATAADAANGATVAISYGPSDDEPTEGVVPLEVGATVITFTVTAEDESTREYTVTVTRSRATVSVEAGATEAAEGDVLTFTVSRDAAPDEPLSVTVDVTESGDLVPAANKGAGKTYTILANALSETFEVQTEADDDTWDEHSTVTATVQANAAYTLGADTEASTLVEDDDFPAATAVLSVDPNPVSEGGGKVVATITVTTERDEEPHGDSPATLTLSASDDTAISPTDYLFPEERDFGFAAAEFTRVDTGGVMRYRAALDYDITITDDDDVEEEEQFEVQLTSSETPTPISLDPSSTPRIVVITNDDASTEAEFALHSDNSDPRGMWSDGTTLWVADETDRKFYAYTLEGGSRDTTKEFNLDSDNSRAEGVWSNGTTIWVRDPGDDKLYAYTLEGGSRDTTKEFDLVDGTPFSTNSNSNPSGIGSDGTTIWVADNNDDKFYAYTLEGGSRDAAKDFNFGNDGDAGVWTDDTTMWTADQGDDKVYAYTISDGSRDSDKDISVESSFNIWGIWSDGETMWIVDDTSNKVYSYDLPRTSSDATLSGLAVSAGTLDPTFVSGTADYDVDVGYGVTQITVTPTKSVDSSSVAFLDGADAALSDADTATGHQVNLAVGDTVIKVKVTAADSTHNTYTLTVTRAKPTVSVEAGATEAAEGDVLTFTVSRDAAPDEALTVTINVDESEDLVPATNEGSKTVTILANAASAEVTVQTAPDDDTWDEHSTVTVTVAANAVHDRGSPYEASTTVNDDDFPAATAVLSFDGGQSTVDEGGTLTVWLTVTVDAPNQEPHYPQRQLRVTTEEASPVSAVEGTDYTAVDASKIVDPGEFAQESDGRWQWRNRTDITVTDDTDTEGAETFLVKMEAVTETIGLTTYELTSPIVLDPATTTLTATINDNDEPASSDATLTALTVSHGDPAVTAALAPAFAGGTAGYDVDVGYGVTQITVTPTKSVASSSFTFLDGADNVLTDADTATGHQVNLAVGDTVIKVKVTAADSTENTYTLTVTRAKPTVSIHAGATEAGEGDLLTFTVTRDASPDEALTVTINVDESEDLVPATNEGSKTVSIAANAASAEVTVQTAAADDTWDEHSTVTVTVQANAVHDRGSPYEAETLVEDDDFPAATAVLSVAPASADEGEYVVATVTITTDRDEQPHGKGWTGEINTAPGSATATADYDPLTGGATVVFNTVADFGRVDIGGGVMRWRHARSESILITDDTDAEDAEQFTVTMQYVSGTSQIVLDATSTPRTVTINASDAVVLSTDATLSALTLSGITFAFDPATTDYEVEAALTTAQTTVTATATHTGATVAYSPAMDADAAVGHQVDLTEGGITTITVLVAPEDTTASTQTYTVRVTRPQLGLSALTLSGAAAAPGGGDLRPALAAGVYDYEARFAAGAATAMTTLSLTKAQSAASLAVELNGVVAAVTGSGDTVTAVLDPLRAGRNTLTITLSATGASDRTYTLELRRASDEPTGWAVLGDFTLDAANSAPAGMWSDGTHLWVAQSKVGSAAAWIFAYDLATGDRVPGEEFTSTVLSAAFNLNPVGIWSDGTTLWVADSADIKIYAYDLGTKVRDAAKDIGEGPYTYLRQQGNTDLVGIWSDGTTMWVVNDGSDAGDGAQNKIFAYDLTTKLRDESKEFNTLAAAGNRSPRQIWSDGKTMWVRNSDRFGTNVKLYAYSMTTRRHLPHKDFNTLKAAGNAAPRGIWGDGSAMWVADSGDPDAGVADAVYTYNYAAPAGDTTLHSLTLSDIGEGGADTALPLSDGLREYSATALDAAVTATTLTPVVTDAADYAVYIAGETIPADITTDTARLNMPREVTLHAWNDTVVTVAVRAEDGSATVRYTVTVRRWDLGFAYTAPIAGTSDEQWELEVTFAQEASVAASPPVSEIELNWQWSLAGSAFAADGTDDADSDAATDRVWRIEVTPHPSFKGPLAASLPAGMFLYGTSGSPAMAEQVEEEINTGPAVWITLTDDDNVAGDGATFDVRFTFTSNYINGSPVGDRDPNAADVDETDFLISDIVVGNGMVTSLTELGPITVDPDDYVANDEYTAEEQAQRLENAREHAAHRLLLLGSLYDATITPGTDCPSMSKNPCVVTVDVPAGAAKDQAGMFNRAGDRLSVTRRTEAATAYVAALTIRRQTVTNHYNVLILIKRGADVVEDLDFASHFQLTGGDLRAESKWPGSYEFWISPTADATAANPLQIKVDLNKDGDFADADEVVYEIDDAKKVTTFLPPACGRWWRAPCAKSREQPSRPTTSRRWCC